MGGHSHAQRGRLAGRVVPVMGSGTTALIAKRAAEAAVVLAFLMHAWPRVKPPGFYHGAYHGTAS